jgi:hypothetical protein
VVKTLWNGVFPVASLTPSQIKQTARRFACGQPVGCSGTGEKEFAGGLHVVGAPKRLMRNVSGFTDDLQLAFYTTNMSFANPFCLAI